MRLAGPTSSRPGACALLPNGGDLISPSAPAVPATPIRVALVNDYDLVVAGVAALLAAHPTRVDVVQLAANRPVTEDVDIVLFDTFGQRLDTDAYLADLVADSPAKVVVYTWRFADRAVAEALALGAAGYLSKALSALEIVTALEAICAGDVVVKPGDVDVDVNLPHVGDWPGRDAGLTPREAEVLAFIAQGLSNQEISVRAYIAVNSLKTHIRAAYRKIGATSRSQAIVWCYEHGFRIGTKPPRSDY